MKNKIKNSKIFITGGAGFVGSHLVEELLPYNPKKIYILDNLFRGSLANMSSFIKDPRVEFIKADIRDIDIVNRIMAKSDYCYHMAALRINACAADPQEAFDVMIKGTYDIFLSAKEHNIKKIIYSSSASVYGLAQHFPTPETDNPYDNQTLYGAAKLFGEQVLRSFYHMYGLNYIALRYFNIYGPRMDTDGKYTEVIIKWLTCIKNKTPPLIFGDGSTSMDFVYVKDVAKANVLALLSETTDQVFNIGDQKETTLKELLYTILKANHVNIEPEHRQENTINPVKRRLADISQAQKILGYQPTVSLGEGVKTLSDWFFQQKND